VLLAVGDVAGKGAGAALLMSSLHALVRSHSRWRAAVGEVMSHINSYVYESTPADKFLTLFYAELDPSTGAVEYSNAGHPPPILVRSSGEVVLLEGGGPPIGILGEVIYPEHSASLGWGDTLVLTTDGIGESVNPKGEEFGDLHLMELIRQNRTCSAAQLQECIASSLSLFTGGARPTDDRTLVVVRRIPAVHTAVSDCHRSLSELSLSTA
jgi:sigma-B regulation protein RsbU (phosphoserine phosphatase)